ncbi:reverse transcriptase domain-containing protein [Tanacetum coccineum]
MGEEENSEFESDTEEPPFEKITINTYYKIKTSLEEHPIDLELKPLLDNLEYVFLEKPSFLPVIISSQLSAQNKGKLVSVLKKHKEAFSWKTTDIPGICPSFCKHKIQLLDDKKPVVQKQRRLNPNMQEVVKKEIVKLLDTGIIYLIADSPRVSPIHCVPKKGGITVVTNKNDELVPTRTITGWRVCIDYRKLNEATAKDYFPLPFMDQILERFIGNKYLCFLDGFSRYFQIPIDPNDQEKTTFTCPFGTYAYRRMPFGLSNAPATFQSDFTVGAIIEFDIEIKDRKGTENVAADHLSRIENDESSDDSDVDDNFPGETLMEIKTKDKPTATYWALKNCNPDLIAAGEKRIFQLHELDEFRHQAYESSRLYKARTKFWHDRKLRMRKEFKHGNKVLLFHSKYKFKQPKLKSHWLGPYVVKYQYPSGYVELYGKDGKTFLANVHRIKLYHEEEDYNDPREEVTPFFPKE